MLSKKYKNLLISVIAVIGFFFFIFHYQEKLKLLVTHPSHFLEMILSAGKVSAILPSILITNIVLLLIAFFLEWKTLGFRHSSIYKIVVKPSKSMLNDFICWLLITLNLFDLFFLLLSFGFFHLLASLLHSHLYLPSLDLFIENQILLFLLLFLLSDFKNYIYHRFMHLHPFWKLHEFHHSAEEFTVFTAFRSHFLQTGFALLLDVFLFLLFKAPVVYFVYFIFLRDLLQLLQHSDVKWSFGWVGRWVINSPKHHRIHHSIAFEHRNKNFGSFLILWDRLFGTYLDTDEQITLGIENNPYNKKGFVADVWLGMKRFYGSIFK